MLDIYVGNIPSRANEIELEELFDEVAGQQPLDSILTSLLLKLNGAAASKIAKFTMVETERGKYNRYCRISGNRRGKAKKIIARLSGAGLHGQVLEVRPFYPRIMTNDRRRAGWSFRRWLGVERRVSERRNDV